MLSLFSNGESACSFVSRLQASTGLPAWNQQLALSRSAAFTVSSLDEHSNLGKDHVRKFPAIRVAEDASLGIALLSLARTSAAQFVPASPPIADPADTRFKGVSEDWRVTILNLPVLPLKLMIRKSHIPRIANDIDYFSISWVKILVRLYNSWASVYV